MFGSIMFVSSMHILDIYYNWIAQTTYRKYKLRNIHA